MTQRRLVVDTEATSYTNLSRGRREDPVGQVLVFVLSHVVQLAASSLCS